MSPPGRCCWLSWRTGRTGRSGRTAGRLLEQVVIDLDATLVTALGRERREGQLQGRLRLPRLGAWLDNAGEALAGAAAR